MKRFAMLAASTLGLSACALLPTDMASNTNPLLSPSTLDYQYPHFDRIRAEHFLPAFESAASAHLAEVEAIATQDTAATFDNTIVALERSGQDLMRTAYVFFGLVGAHTNDTLNEVQTTVAPQMAAHQDKILLNPQLFARIDAIYQSRDTLDLNPEQRRLVERYHQNFVRAGARLSEDEKTRISAINERLSSLVTKFGQNVLKERNDSTVFVSDVDQLAGYSTAEIESAAQIASDAGHDGEYAIKLLNTSSQPALKVLTHRPTRDKVMQASLARGLRDNDYNNQALILEIVRLRAERAQLMGHPNHAAYVLEDSTAQTTQAVNDLLTQLAPKAVANARAEAADLQTLIDAEMGAFMLSAADWPFYAEKLRQQRYAFDESQMRPYLELDRVLHDGVFYMAQALYGLSFKPRKDLPVYHPDVSVWEVFNADGSALGLFLFDPYARDSKRGGAWMNAYVPQNHLLKAKPVVGNHLNITKPPAGEPVLLTFDEVTTLFHEFGHALHGLFSDVSYPMFSGTSVPRDFVEFPSQVHEMWAVWPDILQRYARHYETGEPMPQALVERFLAAKKFNQGYATTEYLAASLLDQAWHQLGPNEIPSDVAQFEKAALKRAGILLDTVPTRYRSAYFSHIFAGGYSAGYYSYIWSEVLDAETVEWFKAHDGLKRINGDWFRENLLSRGGSVDAMELFELFRGRAPRIEPLLEKRGLNAK